jgi:hypothetical protein
MKRILCAAALLVASTAIAYASDPYAGYYGNTVNITSPDGKTDKAMVNADKTWERKNSDGATMKGTYEVAADGKSACFTQKEPAPAADAKPACFPTDSRKAGDTWETKDDKGAVTKWSITAGR